MSFFTFLLGERKKGPTSAQIARERLLTLSIASDSKHRPEYWDALQKELLQVLRKYTHASEDAIKVEVNRQDTLEVLEVKIEIEPDR